MKILITGSTGFIGQNLKEQLTDKYQIYAPSSTNLDLLDEVQVVEYLKKNTFDVIIHAATWNATRASTKNIMKVLENNLRMFFNVARCSSYFDKMIYYGSGAEYDRRHWIPKMTEDYFDTHVPTDQYGFSKYIMRKYAEKYHNIIGLCLFGVFGRHEDWLIRFVSNTCCKAVLDFPITIIQNVFFDYLYIDDLVRITDWFIENSTNERYYNVCTGLTYDLLTLANKVISVSMKLSDIKITRDGYGREYSGNNDKLIKEMRGYVFKDITDCISELYHWYFVNRHRIDKEKILLGK